MVRIRAWLYSLKTKAWLFWSSSIRRRMVLSFSAVTLILMVGFSYLIFNHQRDFLYGASSDRALGVAGALASSSASWVLANDLAGLQEVLNGFSNTPDLKVALVLSPQGEVLGATDSRLVGQFVSDQVSIGLLQSPAQPQVLVNQSQLVDTAFPVMAGNRHIGWARVEMTRTSSNAHLRLLGFAGLGFSLIAVVASLLVATWLARQLTRSLYHLMQVAQIVERGARNVRSTIVQDDEVGKLAHSFNLMLDTLNDSEEELGRLNRLYAAWTESTEIIVRESNEQVLLDSICRILAERVPFELVWFGVPDQDGWVLPVASGGNGIDYLSKVKVSIDEARPEGLGPTGIAIRDGIPSISNDFLNEFKTSPWQTQASNYNYRSVSVFPIFRNGRSYGSIAVYSCEINFFSKELIVLLGGLADDISFALNNLDREKQRQADVVNLERAAKVFEYSKEGIIVTDAANRIISVNRSFTEISGYQPEEVIGKDPKILSSGRHDIEFYQQLWNTLNESGSWQGELWNKRKNGDIYPESLTIISVKDNHGEIINYIAIFGDISERKQAELRIQQLAHYDALTGLPNRVLFTDRLEQAILYAQRNHATLALLFLDLDRFKQINDTLGHGIGDLLLKMVAQRLLECIRDQDTVSRQGGDEFIAVLPGADAAGAGLVADKMLQAIIQPYSIEGHDLRISSSIGISIFPDHAQDADTLIKYADVAMYQAKAAGRNHYLLFNAEMNASAYDRLTLETYLRAALELEQFEIYYQPQVSLTNGSIIGCEALIRWHHPEIGTVSPADFIPIAEETGIIGPISDWILDAAIRQCKVWLDEGMRDFTMGINLSALQFRQRDLHGQVSQLLEQYQVSPGMIDLELTEGILIEGVERTLTILRNLNALGVVISIDDFGTGYSSLSYLKRFPIHKIKIDQSFVRDVVTDSSDATMVQTIVLMANSLKLDVIAEGVETEEQAAFLRKAGCKMAQGYLFGRPMPADAFREFFIKARK